MRGFGVVLTALLLAACTRSPSGDEVFCDAYSRFLRDMVSTDIDISMALAQVPELEELAQSADSDELRRSANRLTLIVGEAERADLIIGDHIDQSAFEAIRQETSTLNYLCQFTE